MTHKTGCTCKKSPGWDLFNIGGGRYEIERFDEAGLFKTDMDAIEHIRKCASCQECLGRRLLECSPAGSFEIPADRHQERERGGPTPISKRLEDIEGSITLLGIHMDRKLSAVSDQLTEVMSQLDERNVVEIKEVLERTLRQLNHKKWFDGREN